MKTIELEERKSLQLEMLNDIACFCEKNNIKYCLAYGTLLGAIRHKGYIPWDDDIDIHMPRPDYNRFVQAYRSENCFYEVLDQEKTVGYNLPFAKVHDKRTVIIEELYKQDKYGIFIDIFPIDGLKEKQQAYKSVRWRRILNAKKAVINKGRAFSKNVLMLMAKVFLLPLSEKFILQKINRIITQYDYAKCVRVCSMCSQLAYKEIFDSNLFDNYIKVDFEGYKFNAPKDYDIYLRVNYGNYMQLPPKEKQVSNHLAQAMWK